MRRTFAVCCSIIPPHIHRHIAEHGSEDERRRARLALEMSAHMRGQREAVAGMRAMLAIAPAEKQRQVFDAKHKRALPGKLVRAEGQKSSGDHAADEAYDGSGKTWDFYSKVYERNSIDGRGLRIDSSVHYSVDYSNAQWNGKQMLYGDGDGRIFTRFTKSLDVIGHELTHGVTQYSAALEYHDQPGALNEHFSDVFGILVKQHALKQTAAKSDWLIGAGIFTSAVHGAAVRSMKAPGTAYDDKVVGKDPQPAHMKNYQTMTADNGGVHVNSGIPNHAFYLAATLLGGKAWTVAGRIWYDALTTLLKPKATFRDCARATVAAAAKRYGAKSEPQRAVVEAWKKVGIDLDAVATSGPKLPIADFEPPAAAAELPPFEHRPRRRATK